MKLNIEIINHTKFDTSKIDIDKIKLELIQKLAKKIPDGNFSICIHLIKKNQIQKINAKFRNIQKPTDVLSFPIYKNLKKINSKQKDINLGDIFICPKIAKLNAKIDNHDELFEIIFLLKHGFKHLIGIHHK